MDPSDDDGGLMDPMADESSASSRGISLSILCLLLGFSMMI